MISPLQKNLTALSLQPPGLRVLLRACESFLSSLCWVTWTSTLPDLAGLVSATRLEGTLRLEDSHGTGWHR